MSDARSWGTVLSDTAPDRISVRGYDLAALIGAVPFPDVVHLLYTGELPDRPTARLIDAVMVACIDHGAGAPSVLAARTAMSGGATLQGGAAAGLLTLGDHHGAAVESAMRALAAIVDDPGDDTADVDDPADGDGAIDVDDPVDVDAIDVDDDGDGRGDRSGQRPGDGSRLAAAAERLVADHRARGRRVPGFGHRQHRARDPRLDRLFAVAREAGVPGRHLAAVEALEVALAGAVGRPVPVNIDGAVAALLGEVGFPSDLGNALFITARLAGILAHANEERQTMRPMRRIDPVGHRYDGPRPRSLVTARPAEAGR